MEKKIVSHLIVWFCIALALALLLVSYCGCIPEKFRQSADMIAQGTEHINKATSADSPLKKDTVAVDTLAKAHSKYEMGEPDERIEYTPEVAEERAGTIEEEGKAFGGSYMWILLLVLLGERGLKSVGLGLPRGLLLTGLKYFMPKGKKGKSNGDKTTDA